MNRLTLLLVLCIKVLTPVATFASSILESFTISTQNVVVREFSGNSIQLKADSSAYFIKLEPNTEGRVIFALSGIGYTSTAKVPNLQFGVKITGYQGSKKVYPTFSLDDNNSDVVAEENFLKFRRINGSIPVWFEQHVDSVNLEFSNSMALDVDQYLGIQDLKIVPPLEIVSNPYIKSCEHQSIMIGIDGSSSINKEERLKIGSQLLKLVNRYSLPFDSSEICIMEFGTSVHAMVKSSQHRELSKAIKHYKRDKNNRSKNTSWTNWSVAFAEAQKQQPDIFIFITDGWSNWSGRGPSSFSAQYADLVNQCNSLKANGTRLLFITSGLDSHAMAGSTINHFLNGEYTCSMSESDLDRDLGFNDTDLITTNGFNKIDEIDLTSILECPVDIAAADD